MAQNLIVNSFTAYDLTDQEVLQGSVFTDLQLKVLQNHLASYAEQKIHLDFDPDNPQKFLQEEAGLKSKIDILEFLIDSSHSAAEVLSKAITE